MIKASLIIIIKDTKEFLPKCLDSIANQTSKNFEVILIDDHSVERSDQVINTYIDRISNITYIYLESDIGPGGCRNRGLDIASGEYIIFLDSDDWLDLGYIENSLEHMDLYMADTGSCGLVRNYDSQSLKPVYKCRYNQAYVLDHLTAFKVLAGDYTYEITVNPSAVNRVYRKSFLEKNHLRFLEKIYYEDILFAFQCFLSPGTLVCIPNTYYHHYKRTGSIVQSLSQRHFDDFHTAFLAVRDYLNRNDLYKTYTFQYYKILERFYNLIVRQIFQFAADENEKKKWLKYSFSKLKDLISWDEYLEYFSSEDIRAHIQPTIKDTTIF